MRSLWRAAALVLVALALSACSTLNLKRGVSDEDLGATRRVGVVALLGNDFYGVFVGTTVFTNKGFAAPVPDWKINATALEGALALLKTNPRFESQPLDTGGLSDEQLKADQGRKLWEAAERQGFDRIVLVRPGVSSNFPFYRPGYGIFERSFFGATNKCIYVAYVVDVYDVATRKPLAWEWGGPSPCQRNIEGPLAFRETFDLYSAEEKAQLRSGVEARLRESLPYALKALSLLPP